MKTNAKSLGMGSEMAHRFLKEVEMNVTVVQYIKLEENLMKLN
jgi:hypothetical protein